MSAPRCKNCAYVRYGGGVDDIEQRCGFARIARPLTSYARSQKGDCGPAGKQFSPSMRAEQ